MGVLNVTPDSFSDGGRYATVEAAVAHGLLMVDQGASVIDVGGESSRPGAADVDADDESERVLPVISELSAQLADRGASDVRISIDTRHASTARRAVERGASIINDITARLDHVAADTGAAWIAMHMRGTPSTMQDEPAYADVVGEVLGDLTAAAERAAGRGVAEVWIDPGIGFGKTAEHNLTLLAATDRLVATGWPVVVGVSRKLTTGLLTAASDHRGADTGTGPLDLVVEAAPIVDRGDVSLAMATWALQLGARMIRTHEPSGVRDAVRVVAGGFDS